MSVAEFGLTIPILENSMRFFLELNIKLLYDTTSELLGFKNQDAVSP